MAPLPTKDEETPFVASLLKPFFIFPELVPFDSWRSEDSPRSVEVEDSNFIWVSRSDD